MARPGRFRVGKYYGTDIIVWKWWDVPDFNEMADCAEFWNNNTGGLSTSRPMKGWHFLPMYKIPNFCWNFSYPALESESALAPKMHQKLRGVFTWWGFSRKSSMWYALTQQQQQQQQRRENVLDISGEALHAKLFPSTRSQLCPIRGLQLCKNDATAVTTHMKE